MKAISIKDLLDAGIHFGHRTNRWNPKMSDFIFGHRNGIHIIDLQQTLTFFNNALKVVEDFAKEGKNILFIGTKRQASDIIERYAVDCNQFFDCHQLLILYHNCYIILIFYFREFMIYL